MDKDLVDCPHVELLDEHTQISLTELSRLTNCTAETVIGFVDEGLIAPLGREPAKWRFTAINVQRVHRARRLSRDLGINTAGAALAVELLEEINSLRETLRRFET